MLSPAETLEIMLRRIAAQRELCVDVETSGLDFNRDHIVGYVVTFGPNPADSYYLPVRHLGYANLGGLPGPSTARGWKRGDMHEGERALIKALDDPRLFLFGHNFGFDLRFMARCGFTFGPQCEDTIVNAAMIDEYMPSFKLEHCAYVARVEAKKSAMIEAYIIEKFKLDAKDAKRPMAHFWRLAGDDRMAHEYAAGDGTTTWQLRDWQHVEIARETTGPNGVTIPSLKKVHGVECRLVRVLARMSATGVKIDVPRLEGLRAQIKGKLADLTAAFPSGFNARGPSDVRKFLESQGATSWPMTAPTPRFPKGQPSFPEEWLVKTEAGRAVVKLRHYLTLSSMFVEPLLTEHICDGRVHTTFNQLRGDEYGTTTGRLSSSKPNMQAIPKRDKEIGKLFRAVFIPDEGKIWFSSDYSQLEPRLLAYYTNSKSLMRGYNSTPPADLHTTVTLNAKLFTPEGKPDRDMGKRCNMLIINGGGAGAMVRKFNMELQQAYKTLDMYFEGNPEIRDFQKRAQRRYGQRGFLLTLLERKIRLRQRKHDYMAVNRILQGGNADVIKLKMVEVDDYLESEGRPLDMLLTIHDAIDGQLDPAKKHHVTEIIRIMQDFGPNSMIPIKGLPILVNYDYGDNWGDATWDEDD